MLVVVVVDLCDEATCDEAEEESYTVEDEPDGSLDAGVRQVSLATITRVVHVAVADRALTDACFITTSIARLVVLIFNFVRLHLGHSHDLGFLFNQSKGRHNAGGWLSELHLSFTLIAHNGLVCALWARVVPVQAFSLQVLALAIRNVEATHCLLHNLTTVLAVIGVLGCHD